jgi:N-acyl-D-amino-acid deacylase
MVQFDLIIRNGTIIDGRRTPRFRGDVGITAGKVAAITGAGGLARSRAKEEIDATDLIVAPGFVDLHTHMDAQIFWDPYATMGGWHGVTSIVIGNCGFGLAPCRPELRERAMQTLTRNEAISYPAMKEGVPWGWETFPEYLDAVDRAPKGVNVVSYVGLAPIFMDVMGVEEAKGRRPNTEEMRRMKALISEAMDAGACGISAQYLGEDSIQRDYDGSPMITDTMHFDDFVEFASVLKEKGRGAIQANGLTMEQSAKLLEESGATLIYNAIALECDQHGVKSDSWQEWVNFTNDCNRRGLRLTPQIIVTGIDYEFTLEEWNLFDSSKAWREVCLGSVAERMEKMRDPARRKALRDDVDGATIDERFEAAGTAFMQFRTMPENTVVLVENADLQKYEGMTLQQIGVLENKHPVDVMLDIAIADDLRTTFATPPNQLNPEQMRELLNAPHTIPGISDGGAHTKFAWFGRYGTEYLTEWVRKHKLVDLEYAHWHLSSVPAMYAGLQDRGVIQVGRPADILIYDYDALGWTPVEKVYDLPAGDWRRISKGVGYRYTIVNGEITFIDSECTGRTPGQLLRHGNA